MASALVPASRFLPGVPALDSLHNGLPLLTGITPSLPSLLLVAMFAMALESKPGEIPGRLEHILATVETH